MNLLCVTAEVEIEIERRKKLELRSAELSEAFKKPKATEFQLRQLELGAITKVRGDSFYICD